jgi:hypothetical protein
LEEPNRREPVCPAATISTTGLGLPGDATLVWNPPGH